MSAFAAMTWKCHVCGRERPDERISVYSEERTIGPATAKVNVRYCNDNPDCRAGAPKVAEGWVKR